MNVSIKERKMEGGKTALYLHTFINGKRQRKSLELTLYTNPETTEQRRENKMTLELAERMRAQALITLQDKKAGINRKDHSKDNFVSYFEKKGLERFNSSGNYGNWDGSLKQFIKCFGKIVSMEEVDLELVRKFKNYLEFEAKTKHGTPLSQNSRRTYFNKFKACVGLAFREKVIKENIADYIDSFEQGETHREHLTFEELEKLAKTPCTYPNLKNACCSVRYVKNVSSLCGMEYKEFSQRPIWQFSIGEFEARLKKTVSTLIELAVKKAFEERASEIADASSDNLDLKKASELTGLSSSTIYSKGSRFQMPSLTRGRPLLFSKKELMTWLASGRPKNYLNLKNKKS